MELYAGVGTLVELTCHALFLHRELELVGLDRTLDTLDGLQTGLDHLALVGLEDIALSLEIVDVSLVDALGIDEAELKEDKSGQHQGSDDDRTPGDYFGSCTHSI